MSRPGRAPDTVLASFGPDLPRASVFLKPASLRLSRPPSSLHVWIELPPGFSAREIDPNRAAITAVGKKTLSRPVRRIAAKGATIADRDRDGRPELVVYFPVKPLLRYLPAGARTRLKLESPLRTWGRFLGYGTLRATR